MSRAWGNRAFLDRESRDNAVAINVGGSDVLCRVLNRYKLYVDGADDSIAPCLMMDGIWEAWITCALVDIVKPGMVAVNVGANVGYYTMLLADLVGPSGQVIAFEPQPRLVDLIRRSARTNGYSDRVEVYPYVVGDTSKNVSFDCSPTSNGYAHVRDSRAHTHRVRSPSEISVAQVRLDELMLNTVQFVMMDVEGSEERVWDGMAELRAKNPDYPIVVLEFTPMFYEDPVRFARKLYEGHQVVELTESGERVPIDLETLCGRYQTNVVLFPRKDK